MRQWRISCHIDAGGRRLADADDHAAHCHFLKTLRFLMFFPGCRNWNNLYDRGFCISIRDGTD
jgi:hypothetical protein